MKVKSNFAKNLKAARESMGKSQRQLAKVCDLSASTIAYFEQGRRSPRMKTLMKLSEKLGTTPSELLK